MKIINKESIKWWGNQKSETWAYKQNGNWYLIKPRPKQNPPSKNKKELDTHRVDWKKIAISCVAGAWIGACAFCLFLAYLLLKNAF